MIEIHRKPPQRGPGQAPAAHRAVRRGALLAGLLVLGLGSALTAPTAPPGLTLVLIVVLALVIASAGIGLTMRRRATRPRA